MQAQLVSNVAQHQRRMPTSPSSKTVADRATMGLGHAQNCRSKRFAARCGSAIWPLQLRRQLQAAFAVVLQQMGVQ